MSLANFITFTQLAILQIAHFIILSAEVRWWQNSHAKPAIMRCQEPSCSTILNVIKTTYKHISFYKKVHSFGTASNALKILFLFQLIRNMNSPKKTKQR